ncbi:MAG: universal stress protein [Halobacteriales archaeon]|nr:universal stress protein [Halobacteriales archaeon]
MTEPGWTVLVPVEVLEGEGVPDAVIELLSTLPVVVLGYHVLPEQTPPGQARLQFEDQAQAKLDDLAAAFREAGGDAESRLVFTHDEEQTLNRVAEETGCEAILIPNPATRIERVLVPLRGEVDVTRIAAFVAAMIGTRDIGVTLYHVTDSADATAIGRSMLDEAADRLLEGGLAASAVTKDVVVSETPIQSIATAATDHDAVVMGESAPSLRSFLFGEPAEQVAVHSLGPVVVVRRERSLNETGGAIDPAERPSRD